MAISSSSTSSPYVIARYSMAKQPSSGLKELLNDLRVRSVPEPQFSWPSDLPEELMDLILEYLPDLSDLIRCRGVCQSWRLAASRKLPPLLLLSDLKTFILSKDYVKRVLVSATKTTNKELHFDLPKMFHFGSSPCISSYRGWLLLLQLDLEALPSTVYKQFVTSLIEGGHKASSKITLSPFSSQTDIAETSPLHLFNPFSRTLIKLQEPPSPLCISGQLRFITSCTASDPNCIIFAYNLSTCLVAFYGLLDRKWSPLFMSENIPVEAIFYQGLFYVVDDRGVLRRLLFDIDCNSFEEEVISEAVGGSTSHRYLVESFSSSSAGGGGLMMVVRRFHLLTNKTSFFEIFKLDWSNGTWEEVFDLGDQALFLAHHDSKLVSVGVHNPEFRRNTIYFVDDLFAHWNSYKKDFGLYDLGNMNIQPLNISTEHMSLPHCRWFQPTI